MTILEHRTQSSDLPVVRSLYLARTLVLLLMATMLGACQSKLTLMPTPEVLKDPRFDVFAANPQPLTSNEIKTFFATTRSPAGGASFFSSKPDDALHLGYAIARIGPESFDASELHRKSTTEIRKEKLEWSLLSAPTLGSEPRGRGAAGAELPAELKPFFDELNQAIDGTITQKLTVYAHGASNTFNWAVSQGAQYQYFTGNNEVMLSFAWPSPGSITGYAQDKARANDAAGDFARLLELLARHSSAERINVVAYSAGGRVVGGALGLLGERYQDPAVLRLGQVYLAQSDQPLDEFLAALPSFYPLVEGLTVTANPGDPVLGLARVTDTRTRLGAPARVSAVEALDLDAAERTRLQEMINSERMSVIDLSRNLIEGFKFSHGSWYENPWVSTDVLVFLLDGLPPQERGLDFYVSDLNYEIWYYPEDYLERLKAVLLALETEG